MFTLSYTLDIFVYQHKLGLCIVNRPCNVNALLGCPRLDFVHARHVFCKETVNTLKRNNQINNHFICTAICIVITFYIQLYSSEGLSYPSNIAIVEEMPGAG